MQLTCRTLVDVNGHIVRASSRFCRLLMMPKADLLGRHIIDITHPDDRTDTRLDMERLGDAARSFTIAKRYIRSDGAAIWARATAVYYRSRSGDSFIRGAIQPAEPDPNLADLRQRSASIFQSLDQWGEIAG